ncbi:MAG: metal ABC transporter permease [Planctomycetes bacterium]|nr:metal ABC transporter permease [Planctomycetota bacterium]
MNPFVTFAPVMLAAVMGGASAGLLGSFVMGMRMPLLAVATAHAALAGAVFGELVGIPSSAGGFAGALVGALVLGWLLRRRRLDPNVALGTLFSLTMGLAFLGIGLSTGPKSAALGLMWGSLLFVTRTQLVIMAGVMCALLLFVLIFGKELKVLLFSREMAAALLPEGLVFAVVLLFAAAVITVNLHTVGGLLLYSLVCNPAVAAMKLAGTYRAALVLSTLLGAVSALGGFVAAYWLDLPVGACIVLFSSLLVGLALWKSGHG